MRNTLIMMCSIKVFRIIDDNSQTTEFRRKPPVPGYFDKPDFYNKDNKPLDELYDNDGNKIDPNKTIIVPGIKEYTSEEVEMLKHDMAKNWFVQWCEVAYYYDQERKKHVNDKIWQIMLNYTPKNDGEPGSHPCKYAADNCFRVMPCFLLDQSSVDWYILWDEADLDAVSPKGERL